jgi:integrase
MLTAGTVGSFLESWLGHVRVRVRASTFDGYRALIWCHAIPALGEQPLEEISALDLQGLYGRLLEGGLSAGTVLNLHLVLTQAFGQAVRWGLLERSPAAGAQPPRPRRPERIVVDPTLLSRLVKAAERTDLQVPVAVAAATGMRRGEILALTWADFDDELTVARVRRTLQPTTSRSRLPSNTPPSTHERTGRGDVRPRSSLSLSARKPS